MRVEISVESIDGVRIAARAGAARVEVCAGLSDGGLTPSAALSEAAAELAEVHVLVLQQLARNWDGSISDCTITAGRQGRRRRDRSVR